MAEYSFLKVKRPDSTSEYLLLMYKAGVSGHEIVAVLDKHDIANMQKEWQG